MLRTVKGTEAKIIALRDKTMFDMSEEAKKKRAEMCIFDREEQKKHIC